MLHPYVNSAKRSFDERDIREKTGRHKYRAKYGAIQGKKREEPRRIRMRTLIVTLDTIIAVHTRRQRRPKVLRYVVRVGSRLDVRYTRKHRRRYRNETWQFYEIVVPHCTRERLRMFKRMFRAVVSVLYCRQITYGYSVDE